MNIKISGLIQLLLITLCSISSLNALTKIDVDLQLTENTSYEELDLPAGVTQ